ncbi:MAG: hypothetical protein QGE99_06025 [SAR202 cluster bacterium]|nr:hypothetical protein [SAR202 cluster bacterium]
MNNIMWRHYQILSPTGKVKDLFRNTVPPTKLANGTGLALRLIQTANDLLLTESRTFRQNPPYLFWGILAYQVVQFSGIRALPFFIIYAPVIILRSDAGLIVSITQIIAISLSVLSLQITSTNYCFMTLKVAERLAFGITTLFFLTAVFLRRYPYLLAELFFIIINFARQSVSKRSAKAELELAEATG